MPLEIDLNSISLESKIVSQKLMLYEFIRKRLLIAEGENYESSPAREGKIVGPRS